MTDLAVKYFFQTGKDTSVNLAIFPAHEYRLTTVGELIGILRQLGLAAGHCHFRFRDYLDGGNVWVDIRNMGAPLPVSKHNEVEIKILRLPVPSNQTQGGHRPHLADHQAQPHKRQGDTHSEDNHKYAAVGTSPTPGGRQTSHPSTDFNILDGSAVHRDHTAPIKKTPFNSNDDHDSRHPPRSSKTHESLFDSHPKKQSSNPSHSYDREFDDFLNTGPQSHPRKPSDNIFGESKKAEASDEQARAPKPAEKKKAQGDLGDLMNLEVNDYVNKTSYSDIKDNEATRQRQKIESSAIIDPKIKKWAYQNNIQRDIRTLLTTLHEVMDNDPVWERVELADILTEGALKKKALGAIVNLHPDKHQSAPPFKMYLYQRVVEEINSALRNHKNRVQG